MEVEGKGEFGDLCVVCRDTAWCSMDNSLKAVLYKKWKEFTHPWNGRPLLGLPPWCWPVGGRGGSIGSDLWRVEQVV